MTSITRWIEDSTIAPQAKRSFQTRHQPQQQGHDAGVTRSIARSQTHREQASGVTLEDQQRRKHGLAVGAVKEAELLLAMRRIIGRVEASRISPH